MPREKRRKRTSAMEIRASSAEAAGEVVEGPLTVAVTGATGFVGSKLTAALLRRGDRVHVLTRDARRARGVFPDPRVSVFGNDAWADGIATSDGQYLVHA